MADRHFEIPRLAEILDPLDHDRADLDVYVALVDELGAQTILDIGCGTGTFASLLVTRGMEVIGVDPANASLDVARRKPGADRVRWLHQDATTLPPMQVDLATMTGNVAQVFVTDNEWMATLQSVRRTTTSRLAGLRKSGSPGSGVAGVESSGYLLPDGNPRRRCHRGVGRST